MNRKHIAPKESRSNTTNQELGITMTEYDAVNNQISSRGGADDAPHPGLKARDSFALNNPLAELALMLDQTGRVINTILNAIAGVVIATHRVDKNGGRKLTVCATAIAAARGIRRTAAFIPAAALFLSRAKNLRQAMIWFLTIAMLAQSNTALGSALSYRTPAERARDEALARIKASAPKPVPPAYPVRHIGRERPSSAQIASYLAPVASFAEAVFHTVFPVDQDIAPPDLGVRRPVAAFASPPPASASPHNSAGVRSTAFRRAVPSNPGDSGSSGYATLDASAAFLGGRPVAAFASPPPASASPYNSAGVPSTAIRRAVPSNPGDSGSSGYATLGASTAFNRFSAAVPPDVREASAFPTRGSLYNQSGYAAAVPAPFNPLYLYESWAAAAILDPSPFATAGSRNLRGYATAPADPRTVYATAKATSAVGPPTPIFAAFSPSSLAPFLPFAQTGGGSNPLTDAIVSVQPPTLNSGSIQGTLRVFTGKNFNYNGGMSQTGDLFVPGTPTINLQSGSSYAGIVDDGGATTPTYTITLQGGVKLPGKIHIHANPLSLPSDIPTSIPNPAGTRTVNINQPSDVSTIGSWSTVQSLSVNTSNVSIDVPPGNYGQFTMNSGGQLNFSAGTYNFANSITLNGGAKIQCTGAVFINIAQNTNINAGTILPGPQTGPGDIEINILGGSFNLNAPSSITGQVRAPKATVNLNSACTIRGQLIGNQVGMNGATVIADFTSLRDVTPPLVAITSPANNSTTAAASITVQGTAQDTGPNQTGVASVVVNGIAAVYNASAGTWAAANVPLSAGANTITATATDGAGNQSTATVTVTRVVRTAPPAVAITQPATGAATQATSITVSGTVSDPPPNSTGIVSVVVNGTAAVLNVTAGTWSLAGVPLALGSNTITAVATDGAGIQAAASITVTRNPVPPPDTVPPVVTITSPANQTTVITSTITVTGTATDSEVNGTGVGSVTVNGVAASYDPGSHIFTATGVALAVGANTVTVQASDNATPTPNVATATVTVTRRVVPPPTLSITYPAIGSVLPATSITVAGNVTSGASDVPVTVTVNGSPASVAGGQFTATVSLNSGSNTVTVDALDSFGQKAETSVSVTSDTSPPAVALGPVPATVQAGGNYPITATASDSIGLAEVDFTVNGQTASAVTAAPFQFTFSVPITAAAGQVFVVAAVAKNLAGLTSVDTAQAQVSGPGGLSGYAFDDSTGYPVPGATAAQIAATATATTDATGLFSFVTANPTGFVRITQTGYTPVERGYSVGSGLGTSLFDSRLTPLDPTSNLIPAAGGTATGSQGQIHVVLAAGSFPDQTDVRVTLVSQQGIANLLPFGWSPVPGAVVDIRPATGTTPATGSFPSPAELSIPQVPGLVPATPLVLARYDESAHQWIAIQTGLASSANGSLTAFLPGPGQYAFLVADIGATAPPAQAQSQPLTAAQGADPAALAAGTATATATPSSAVMSATAKSLISVVAVAPSQLPSGISIDVTFEETYNLLTSSNPLLVDRPNQDFVAYAYPAATAGQPNNLGATFVAKPTRTDFTVATLKTANVHVVIRAGRAANTGVLIGQTGGSVTTPDGSEIDIPAGAVTGNTPVFLSSVPANSVGLSLPAGFDVVGGLDVDLSGVVLTGAGATISVPIVSGDTSLVVVAQMITLAGLRSPRLVARAVVNGAKLSSSVSSPPLPAGITLPGITAGGRYVFIRDAQPFGYITGKVTNASDGSAANMVGVSVDVSPFVDVTGSAGIYTVLGAAGSGASGANSLIATSVVTDSTGSASAALAAQDAVATVPIQVAPVPLSVLSVTPPNGATGVIVTSPISITFSKPVNPATVTGSTFGLTFNSGNPVLGQTVVLSGNRTAVFTPNAKLASGVNYTVGLTTGVQDIYGNALGAAFQSSFTTAAPVGASNQLQPAQISIGYPDSQGFAAITIPAGAVPLGSVVVAINNTTGATVTAVAGALAVTMQLQAKVGDAIVIIVQQPDGTQYQVTQAAYQRGDGFTTVGAQGGALTSADGTMSLTIPAGAITGQANIQLTAKPESAITIPRTGMMDPSIAPWGATVEVNAQGTFTVNQELHLEAPAPSTLADGTPVCWMTPGSTGFNGQTESYWQVVTSGRVDGGKFKTNSPPFDGILFDAGVTDFSVFTPPQVQIVLGTVTQPPGAGQTAPQPVQGVLCIVGSNVTDPGNTIAARTNAQGGYAAFNTSPGASGAVGVVAIDTAGNRRAGTVAVPQTSVNPLDQQGLQGFANTLRADITLPAATGGGGGTAQPPVVTLSASQPGVPAAQDSLVQFHTVTVGANVKVTAAVDRAIGQITGNVLVGGAVNQALSWTQDTSQTGAQGQEVWFSNFTASSEGSYSVVVNATTNPGDPTTTTQATLGFIALANPNTRPPLPGAPFVLDMTPPDGATAVDVSTTIHIDFSQPVLNLIPGQTVVLADDQNNVVSGTITSGGTIVAPTTPGISSIDFHPATELAGSKHYCMTVTSGVVSSTNVPLDQVQTGAGDTTNEPFKACFSTFGGLVLTDNPIADNSFRVATVGIYAVTISVNSSSPNATTLNVYDMSNPQAPVSTMPPPSPQNPPFLIPQRGLDIAAADDVSYTIPSTKVTYKQIAVVTAESPLQPDVAANLWVISLDNAAQPQIIGVVSLYFPAALPTAPLGVQLHGGRAYIGNSPYLGTMVVDIGKAIGDYAAATAANPSQPAYFPAVTPNQGFGFDGLVQAVSFGLSSTSPASAISVSAMDQDVTSTTTKGHNPTGVMSVGYTVDSVGKQLIPMAFPTSLDGITTLLDTVPAGSPGSGVDDRILSFAPVSPQDSNLSKVVAVPNVPVANQTLNLAVVLGDNRLYIFNVTDPVNPSQYPSVSFAQLGISQTASTLTVEGTLAYVGFNTSVAVIDISNPASPALVSLIAGVSTGLSGIAVKNGFIVTSSTKGVSVSAANPSAVVFVHGNLGAPLETCANPVLIDRKTQVMQESAEIFFEIFGHATPATEQIVISKNGVPLTTLVAQPVGTPSTKVATGHALWFTPDAIDTSAVYTAQAVIDQGTGSEFDSHPEPIAFSPLIATFLPTIGVTTTGSAGAQAKPTFSYLLAGVASVTLTINNAPILTGVLRSFGNQAEQVDVSGLKPGGQYPVSLSATTQDGTITDSVSGILSVVADPIDVRPPGRIVVDGVDLISGNLGLTYDDIGEIKNRGLSLKVERSYNSLGSGVFSPFGYGWHYNYEMLLSHNSANNSYTVTGGDAQGETFLLSHAVNGTFISGAPFFTTLVQNSDGSFDYFTKSHVLYHFAGAMEEGQPQFYNQGYMGNLAYIQEPNGNRITLAYDTNGRMAQASDSSGRSLNFTYEQAATPFVGMIAPAAGTTAPLECLPKGQFALFANAFASAQVGQAWRITKISGPGGLVLTYQYDSSGNLATCTRSNTDSISQAADAPAAWNYTYGGATVTDNPTTQDVSHRLATVISPNHHVVTYQYTTTGLTLPASMISRATAPANVVTRLAYTFPNASTGSTVPGQVTVTDGRGLTTTYAIAQTADNPPQTTYTISYPPQIDPVTNQTANSTALVHFNQKGEKDHEVDALGMTTDYQYDGAGNVSSMTMTGTGGDGKQVVRTVSAAYDSVFNKLTSYTDANGNSTTYRLDNRGNVNEIDLPIGSEKVLLTYLANGDLKTVTDQRGLVTSFDTFDSFGNPTQITKQTASVPVGGQAPSVASTSAFDVRSRLKTSGGTISPSVVNTYDALDHVLTSLVTDPAGIRDAMTAKFTYLAEGQVQTVSLSGSGAQAYTATETYDGVNRLVESDETVASGVLYKQTYGYDPDSNLVSATDRRGVTTAYAYDGRNFRTTTTASGAFGGNKQTIVEPDAVGNAVSFVDIYGQQVKFTYDGIHRLLSRLYPDNRSESVVLDLNGNVTSSTDRNSRQTQIGSYDALNRPQLVTDPLGHRTTLTYDDADGIVTTQQTPQNLTVKRQTDGLNRPLAQEITFSGADYTTSYSYSGLTTTITDPRNVVTTEALSAFGEVGKITVGSLTSSRSYSILGGLQSFTDADSRTSTFDLDGLNRTTGAHYPGGVSETFGYDGDGNVVSHADRRGISSAMTYDNINRLLTNTVGGIQVLGVVFNDGANPGGAPALATEIRSDANNNQTTLTYDSIHRVTSVTRADGAAKNYAYDGVDLTAESDFKGVNTQYQYDNLDRVTQITDRLKQITTIAHTDTNGDTVTVTDRRGNQRVMVYDPLQRLVSVTSGGQPLMSYQYDGNNNVASATDGLGHVTGYTYDNENRVIQINHAGVDTETFTRDGVGNVLSYNSGFGASIQQTFDGLDHVSTVTDGAGNTAGYTFDGEGLLESKKDPRGNQTGYQYNALGSLTQVTDAAAGVWNYAYDNDRNLLSVTDALNHLTSYSYDNLNRLTSTTQTVTLSGQTSPSPLTATYGYDANNNRNLVKDAKGQTSNVGYDALDRATTVSYTGVSGPGPRSYGYGYDPEGNLTSVSETLDSGSRSSTATYDARNRMTGYTDGLGRKVGYAYDAADNVTTLSDAAGKQTGYSFDAMNRVTGVTAPSGSPVTYNLEPNGLINSVNYPNGLTRAYQYDGANRISSVVNTMAAASQTAPADTDEFDYQYDADSNRSSETRQTDGKTTRTIAYQYDSLNRLHEAAYTTPPAGGTGSPTTATMDYSYDAAGNRLTASGTSPTGAAVNLSYSYDEQNRLSAETGDPAGSISFAYDNNGNLSTEIQAGKTTSFGYDGRDQLRTVTGPSGSQVASYDYDFMRRRLSRSSGSGLVTYAYDGDRVIDEFGSGGTLQNRYDYGQDLARGEIGGEGERFYFSDGLGSVTGLSGVGGGSSTTGPAARYEYDAWGSFISSGTSGNTFGFTGQKLDSETGLMALGNGERYYSSSLGRFTQEDAWAGLLDDPQMLNHHAYVGNNPLGFVDPTGLDPDQPYYREGYIEHSFNYVEDWLNKNTTGSWYLDFFMGYQTRAGRSSYHIIDSLLGGGIHREDRLLRNWVNGRISYNRFMAGSLLNYAVSGPEVLVNVGLLLAGGSGAFEELGLAKMAGLGGLLGAAMSVESLLAEDTFNKAIYNEPFHGGWDYGKAAITGAGWGMALAFVGWGLGRLGVRVPGEEEGGAPAPAETRSGGAEPSTTQEPLNVTAGEGPRGVPSPERPVPQGTPGGRLEDFFGRARTVQEWSASRRQIPEGAMNMAEEASGTISEAAEVGESAARESGREGAAGFDETAYRAWRGTIADRLERTGNYGMDIAPEGMATPVNPRQYSVIFEAEMSAEQAALRSRPAHFRIGNEALLRTAEEAPEFAEALRKIVPGFERVRGVRVPARSISPAEYVTWHHVPGTNRLQLVFRYQHELGNPFAPPGSPWRDLFHPGGAGGYSTGGEE